MSVENDMLTGTLSQFRRALSAVVELHCPDYPSGDPFLDSEWPCRTIQAIQEHFPSV